MQPLHKSSTISNSVGVLNRRALSRTIVLTLLRPAEDSITRTIIHLTTKKKPREKYVPWDLVVITRIITRLVADN